MRGDSVSLLFVKYELIPRSGDADVILYVVLFVIFGLLRNIPFQVPIAGAILEQFRNIDDAENVGNVLLRSGMETSTVHSLQPWKNVGIPERDLFLEAE